MERELFPADFEAYERADKLNRSTTDPGETPYKSKYEARTVFETIRFNLTPRFLLERGHPTVDLHLVACYAHILYKLGVNHLETDERPTAELFFSDCVNVVKELADQSRIVFIYISVQNHLSFIYSERSDNEKTLSCLHLANEAYAIFKERNESIYLHLA